VAIVSRGVVISLDEVGDLNYQIAD
jgi:hypothetical protein